MPSAMTVTARRPGASSHAVSRLPVTVIADGMAASRLRRGDITCVLVGADRIAANGDVANKIGTYGLALAARAHGVPFYVAAPSSTVDLATPDGAAIPIEERAAEEVAALGGRRSAPAGVQVWNPAFDVTPAELVTAIITDRGVFEPADVGGRCEPHERGLIVIPSGARDLSNASTAATVRDDRPSPRSAR